MTTEWLNGRCRELLATGGVKRQGPLKLRSLVTYRKHVVTLINFIVSKRGLERSPFVDEKLPAIQIDPDLKSCAQKRCMTWSWPVPTSGTLRWRASP